MSYSYFVFGNIKQKQTSEEEYNTLIINIVIFVVCGGIPYILAYIMWPKYIINIYYFIFSNGLTQFNLILSTFNGFKPLD